MEEQYVVSVKDIEEIYGSEHANITTYSGLDSTPYKNSINKVFLDEEIVVTLVNTMGPYSTVALLGNSSCKLILPKDKVILKDKPVGIDAYKKILDNYFPNRWWYDNFNCKLYLHYPELEITNKFEMKHTIYDLVVRLGMTSNGCIDGLTGRRYSFTKSELLSEYSHSHLPKLNDSYGRFKGFCLGGSSKFGNLFKGMYQPNTSKKLEFFLMQLQAYLEWESVDSRPFISMSSIGTSSSSGEASIAMSSQLLYEIALYSIHLLSTLEGSMIRAVNGSYVLDVTMNDRWFFNNIELAIVNKFGSRLTLFDWDDRALEYVGSDDSTPALPTLESTDNEVISKLNISPRIVESIETGRVTIKRLARNHMGSIIKKINELLYNGNLTPKVVNEQGTQITA